MNSENNNNIQFQQEYQNNISNDKKKKKYWLIPVLVFVSMIMSKIIEFILLMFEINSNFTNTLFSAIFFICGFAFIPSIIIAIVLSLKNK